MTGLVKDIHLTARGLARRPGFTLSAILILALGIAANVSVYSVVNAFLLRPLPFVSPSHLVLIWGVLKEQGIEDEQVSMSTLLEWRDRSHGFAGLEGYLYRKYNVAGEEAPEVLPAAHITAGMFRLLGVTPLLGRDFRPGEDRRGQAPLAILSYAIWRSRYGGRRDIVGRVIRLDGQPATIIGVMRPGLEFPQTLTALWVPLATDPPQQERDLPNLQVVGRLKASVTRQQVSAEMDSIMAALRQIRPKENAGLNAGVVPLREALLFHYRAIRMSLVGAAVAVAFLLMIVCSNVANLTLARNLARSREIAVRNALGASSGQLLRLFFLEAALLSLSGGAAGLVLGDWCNHWLDANIPWPFFRVGSISIDHTVLLFAAAEVILAAAFIGTLPFIQAGRVHLVDHLKESSASASLSRSHRRLAGALVIGQVCAALLLLTGTGLVVGSLIRSERADTGIDPEQVAAFELSLPRWKYPEKEKIRSFYRTALMRTAELPGIDSVALVNRLPFNNESDEMTFSVGGRDPVAARPNTARVYRVTPDYFRVLGIRLLEGRLLAPPYDEKVAAALVNHSFAERYWPRGTAPGRSLELEPGSSGRMALVLGVVADTMDSGADAGVQPEIFTPLLQTPARSFRLVARSRTNPANDLGAIRNALLGIEPDLAIISSLTMRGVMARPMAMQRLASILLALLSACSLALAISGLYGLMAFLANQRVKEIGIRMALGAERRDLIVLLVWQGLKLAAAGIGIGLVASIGLGRVLGGALYGIGGLDIVAPLGLGLALLAVAAVASYLPVRRQTRLEPVTALRL